MNAFKSSPIKLSVNQMVIHILKILHQLLQDIMLHKIPSCLSLIKNLFCYIWNHTLPN